ncbi:MAG: hypothetical protein Q7R84_00610 [bacterium]|nr:hypothetical protein [bacterium]
MNYQNNEQDKRIEKISNHVEIMNKEFGEFLISNTTQHGEIKTEMQEMRTDLDWIKRFFWIIATTSMSGGIFFLSPPGLNRDFYVANQQSLHGKSYPSRFSKLPPSNLNNLS